MNILTQSFIADRKTKHHRPVVFHGTAAGTSAVETMLRVLVFVTSTKTFIVV